MISAALLLSGLFITQEPDTIQTATVSAERGITVSRKDTILIKEHFSVTELLQESAGAVVTDNGGPSGLKTVNLRGLGSPNTSIFIDGLRVGNVQSGQLDLGILPMEHFEVAVIDYAQNSVNFCTKHPEFKDETVNGRIKMNGGSFNSYRFNGNVDFKITDKMSLSIKGAGIISEGNYPYEKDLKRNNNDIGQYKGGIDLFGGMDRGIWKAKAYLSKAERGTPGSVNWPSSDRQNDLNSFFQAMAEKDFSSKYHLMLTGKISSDRIAYSSEWGDSDYHQTEIQLNSNQTYIASNWIQLCTGINFIWDRLASNYYGAQRANINIMPGMRINKGIFSADVTAEYRGIFDKEGKSIKIISPATDFKIKVSKGLGISGFARRAFREATFNELYYPGYGNPELLPEDALLTDMGIDYHKSVGTSWTIKGKIDCFYNRLTNKITSAPNPDNESEWLPYNIGKVNSRGIDIITSASGHFGVYSFRVDARYSYQNAENVPYLSKHSAIISINGCYKKWSIDSRWNWRAGRRDSYGPMKDWNTIDLSIKKGFKRLTMSANCSNLNDCRYELASGYPLPGRSWMLGIEIKI